MCGISVLLDRAASPAGVLRLARMHASIPHRGPDGEGFLLVERGGRAERRDTLASLPGLSPLLSLASRRLKILDLSEAAAQPLGSPDGSAWLVYNGEVYNYRELREELRARGRVFRSSGDAEVVLAAYEAWGTACFERFEGMWALALADLRRRRLVASRDRLGIKPLHWAAEGDRLYLASEARQIVAARGERPRVSAPLLAQYLRGRRLPCLGDTFFEGIRLAPAATWCEVPFDAGALEPSFTRYWDLGDFRCPDPEHPPLSYPEAVERLRALLGRAVEQHSLADVGVGSLLSGGLDSSALTSLAADCARARGATLPTFSFGFRGAGPGLDELPHADALARALGLPQHETALDAAWLAARAPQVVRALEEPPLALPVVAQYRLFELCHERGVRVLLDGQGADEILAGYGYDERALLVDHLAGLRLGALLREARAIGAREQRGVLALASSYFATPALARLRQRRLAFLARGYGGERDVSAVRHDLGRDPSRVNRRLHYDVKWGNVTLVLGYTDRSSMAHSLEARVPYLDRRVVEFAFALPDHYKVGGGERKRLLRDAARPLLPPAITQRTDRVGFGVPEVELVREGVWPAARQRLEDPRFLAAPCVDAAGLRRFLADYAAGRHDDARSIWRLYAFELWREAFDVVIA